MKTWNEYKGNTINEEKIEDKDVAKAKAMYKSLSKDLSKKVSQIADLLKKDDKFWVSQWGTVNALTSDIQRNIKGVKDSFSRLGK